MRLKSVILLVVSSIVTAISLVHAEENSIGKLAIGVHGVGSQWDEGQPTLRWRATDYLAIDLTVPLQIRDASGDDPVNTDLYGVNVGFVSHSNKATGLVPGIRFELGYQRYNFRWGSLTDQALSYEAAIGPDFEYFVSSVPGFSVGAHALVRYTYSDEESKNSTMSGPKNTTSRNIDLVGQMLTLRYYFR